MMNRFQNMVSNSSCAATPGRSLAELLLNYGFVAAPTKSDPAHAMGKQSDDIIDLPGHEFWAGAYTRPLSAQVERSVWDEGCA